MVVNYILIMLVIISYNSSNGAKSTILVDLYWSWCYSETRAHISVTDNGGDGSLSYNSSNGVISYTGPGAAETRAHISVTDNGGDGSLSYNSSNGVISYTGPGAAETRAHFSGGTGVSITNGTIAIGQSVSTSSNPVFNNLFIGDVGHSNWPGIVNNSISNKTNGYALIQNDDGDTRLNSSTLIGFAISNVIQMTLNNSGNLVCNNQCQASSFKSTSDEKMKNNITQLDTNLMLNKITSLKGVSFEFKKNMGETHLGVIAQDVEKQFPELVEEGEHKCVNYDGFVGPFIECFKALKTKTDNLENQNKELMNQNKLLESKIKKIESILESLTNKITI